MTNPTREGLTDEQIDALMPADIQRAAECHQRRWRGFARAIETQTQATRAGVRPLYWPFESVDELRSVLSRLYDRLHGEEANAVRTAYHALVPVTHPEPAQQATPPANVYQAQALPGGDERAPNFDEWDESCVSWAREAAAPAGQSSAARDAARYRCLREMNWFDSPLCVVVDPKRAVKLGHDCPSGSRLDEAIDAALAQQATDSKG